MIFMLDSNQFLYQLSHGFVHSRITGQGSVGENKKDSKLNFVF